MAVLYLDASAIFKRYRTEKGSEVVAQILANPKGEDRFYTSFLSVLEITSAVARLVHQGSLTEHAGGQVLARYRQDVLDGIYQIWPLTDELLSLAADAAWKYRLRSGDAIHMATAGALFEITGPGVLGVVVSSDRELLRAATSVGVATLDPEAEDAPNQFVGIRKSNS